MENATSNSKIWGKIKRELSPSYLFRSHQILPTIISGILVGFMTSLLSISFAVLVFGNTIPEALPVGIGMALFSNLIFHLASALGSSGEGVIYHVQSLPPPIQAAMLSSTLGLLPLSISIENKIVVVVLLMWFSAVFTGVVLFLLGHLKLGRFVRFLPLPVISGFLASIGIALVIGGIRTMVSVEMSFVSLSNFFSTAFIFKWLPGIIFAVAVWIVTVRWKHQLSLPIALGIAVLLFYLFCYAQGWHTNEMSASELLLGPFSYKTLWQSPNIYYSQIHLLDWKIIASQMGTFATIPLLCFIAGLLMLSAIELSTDSKVEPNFDLETMGISNIISGIMGGGFVGYPSTTFTVMQRNLGASTRLAGILSAIIPIILLAFGASFLNFIPRFVVGGLLIYFGYQFIDYWVIKSLKQTSLSDISVLGSIVITALALGFLPSVSVGILVAIFFFLFKYSQTSVIRYASTGQFLRSNVTRNTQQEDWLSAHVDSIAIFGLQGYIFFGTSHTLQEEILVRVMDSQQISLNAVILDFRHVTGIDTSAIQGFQKLHLQLKQKNISLIFAQIPIKYQTLMQKAGFVKELAERFAEFSNLDEALEWVEDSLLENSDLPPSPPQALHTVFAEYFKDISKSDILLPYLTRLEVNTGTKIIEKNTESDDLFFIESGRLSIYAEQEGRPPMRLETIMSDGLIGEIGFYLGLLRTATVIADAPSIVYCLSRESLAKLENEQPTVAMALHKLIVEKTAKRINHVNKSIKRLI